MTDKAPEFVISQSFAASRDLVFKAWTEKALLDQWWGPKGFTISSSTQDLKAGGYYHYAMKMMVGFEMWGKFVYREIAAPERVVFVNCFSNAAGEITRHPLVEQWPRETLSTITFEEDGANATKVTVNWTPLNATPAENAIFVTGMDSMKLGWLGTFDQFAGFLATQNKTK